MATPLYDWVLFDLDETLLDFPASKALTQMLHLHGVPATESLLAEYKSLNHHLWEQYHLGQIDSLGLQERRFAPFAPLAGVTAQAMNEAFLQQIVAMSEPLEGVRETLAQLRGRVRMGIITNGFSETQRGRLVRHGWSDWFEPLVISDEIQYVKPEPAIFQHALSLMGQPDAARVLMVGDNPHTDIAGAAAQGLATCWYNPAKADPACAPTHEIHHFSHLSTIVLGG
ncbi:MAG TPA: pyrimidine 5'-nucleotidase [Pantanalinema sp.]